MHHGGGGREKMQKVWKIRFPVKPQNNLNLFISWPKSSMPTERPNCTSCSFWLQEDSASKMAENLRPIYRKHKDLQYLLQLNSSFMALKMRFLHFYRKVLWPLNVSASFFAAPEDDKWAGQGAWHPRRSDPTGAGLDWPARGKLETRPIWWRQTWKKWVFCHSLLQQDWFYQRLRNSYATCFFFANASTKLKLWHNARKQECIF